MAEGLVTSIIEKLKEPALKEVSFLHQSVAGKVDSVREKLEWINSTTTFLTDAESRSINGEDHEGFDLWVEKIRRAAYRIEDAVDLYAVEIEGDPMTTSSDMIPCVKWVYEEIIVKLVALRRLGAELGDIELFLKEIAENSEKCEVDGSKIMKHWGSRPALRYEHRMSMIVGLEADKEVVVGKLLDPKNPAALHVISIVGTAGLGKTTLARKIFNSTEVKESFDILIWLSVSQEFQVSTILRKMLRQICGVAQQDQNQDDVGYLVDKIRSSLMKKKFLIVLDDIWSEMLWHYISVVCPSESDDEMTCGRVLITTRHLNVAQKADSEQYKLRFLEVEESKMLLYKVSFPDHQEPPEGLDTAATEIAKKCGGLPLAVAVVGGRLFMEHRNSQWRNVAESIDWPETECMKTLSASYDDMPVVLKTCFMYLASFPEDYLIDARSLLRTWVAENLVPDEVSGEYCLQELAQRCLIIVCASAYDGSVEKFCVHDLLLELAIKKAEENKFMSVFTRQIPYQNSFNNARRASLQSSTLWQSTSNFKNESEVKRYDNRKLRVLLVFGESLLDYSELRLLKVLKVHDCGISFSNLEKLCEELIHLRHLEFRSCEVERRAIPESFGHLKNLLTLDCTGTDILHLPESLWSITTLRHLIFDGQFNWPRAPLPSADLPNLNTLWYIEFPRITDQWRPNCFLNLRELAIYYNDPWILTVLNELNELVRLKINWKDKVLPLDVNAVDTSALPFYQKLRCLHLEDIEQGAAPNFHDFQKHFWPPHLTRLVLRSIKFNDDPMPELEKLQNLEILNLERCSCDGDRMKFMICSDGGFPRLERLSLSDFVPLEMLYITLGAMPVLKILHMKGFWGLKKIPKLRHLVVLREFEWTDARHTGEEFLAIRQENKHILSFTIKR